MKIVSSTTHKPRALAAQDYKLRLIKTITKDERSAKVYYDPDWQEYRVKFYESGKHLGEEADNHTDDKEDAIGTAEGWVNKKWGVSASIGNKAVTNMSDEELLEAGSDVAMRIGHSNLPAGDVMIVWGLVERLKARSAK